VTPPASQTAAVPELPANLPVGHEYGLSNGDTRVLIRALGSAWIRVSDKDGKPVFTQTLLAGDTYHVPNEPGLTFKTGVAKSLAFFVDGHQVPRISGFARSNVSLDPDRLIAGNAGD
jgi:cytoskeleton protein RodZ